MGRIIKDTDFEYPFWAKAFETDDCDIISHKLHKVLAMRGRIMTHSLTKRELYSHIGDMYAFLDGMEKMYEMKLSNSAAQKYMELRSADEDYTKLQKKYDEAFKKFNHLLNRD